MNDIEGFKNNEFWEIGYMNMQNPDIKIRYIKTKNKTRRITTYVSKFQIIFSHL